MRHSIEAGTLHSEESWQYKLQQSGRRTRVKLTLPQLSLIILGVAILCAGMILHLIATFEAMLWSNSERVAVERTGLPTIHNLLRWSEWQSGPGELKPSWHRQDAIIVSHRIGSRKTRLSQLTFYQAKYRLADGSTLIAIADGPNPFIAARKYTKHALRFAICAAALSFILATRIGAQLEDSRKGPTNQ